MPFECKVNLSQIIMNVNKSGNSVKIEHNLVVYALILLCTVQIAFDNILYFSNIEKNTKIITAYCLLVQKYLILGISFIKYIKIGSSLKYIFMVDNIFLISLASFVTVGTGYALIATSWFEYVYIPCYLVQILILSAVFRGMVKHARWQKWEVIVYKIGLLASGGYFIMLGCYVYIANFKVTDGEDQRKDSIALNFIGLYSSINFGYYFQLYNKMSDFDGTAELQWEYQMKEEEDMLVSSDPNQQILQNSRKPIQSG